MDCCCGTGFGSYILSLYSRHVYAVDIDATVINENISYWPKKNITWAKKDVVHEQLYNTEMFDLVTGMEMIEHFSKHDGMNMLKNVQSSIKKNGHFVGTSTFPKSRIQADNHKSLQRPGHLYLWTQQELIEELSKYFREINIIDGWMFIAKK